MAEGASAYADTTELAARWRALTADELVKADLYLGDVTRDIRRDFPGIDSRIAADAALTPETQKGLDAEVRRITCNVVRRRITGEEYEGLEQLTDTRGPFARSRTPKASDGQLEITPRERRILAGDPDDQAETTGLAAWSNDPVSPWPSLATPVYREPW